MDAQPLKHLETEHDPNTSHFASGAMSETQPTRKSTPTEVVTTAYDLERSSMNRFGQNSTCHPNPLPSRTSLFLLPAHSPR